MEPFVTHLKEQIVPIEAMVTYVVVGMVALCEVLDKKTASFDKNSDGRKWYAMDDLRKCLHQKET